MWIIRKLLAVVIFVAGAAIATSEGSAGSMDLLPAIALSVGKILLGVFVCSIAVIVWKWETSRSRSDDKQASSDE